MIGSDGRALRLGDHELAVPVVLAPMAGITNRSFRRLCREYGAGLYVSEMVTARAYIEGSPRTRRMMSFASSESPRSLQFYAVDPETVAAAVTKVVADDAADHVDLNFGCPVPKVTRKGGGAALPWKADLFRRIVAAAVCAARGRVPITVKMRTGIDAGHLTFREAGVIAEEEGVAWVALHGRTAEQFYGGQVDRAAIAWLKDQLVQYGTPVLGNGDIWSASDALSMIRETGCDGVVIGRGCLGRPWLFGQLADAFSGRPIRPEPDLDEVVRVYRRHAELLVTDLGEYLGCREIRKHHAWYFKGFRVPSRVRLGLGQVESLADVDRLLAGIDRDQGRTAVPDGPRGRTNGARPVALPEGWLASRSSSGRDAALVVSEDVLVGGG